MLESSSKAYLLDFPFLNLRSSPPEAHLAGSPFSFEMGKGQGFHSGAPLAFWPYLGPRARIASWPQLALGHVCRCWLAAALWFLLAAALRFLLAAALWFLLAAALWFLCCFVVPSCCCFVVPSCCCFVVPSCCCFVVSSCCCFVVPSCCCFVVPSCCCFVVPSCCCFVVPSCCCFVVRLLGGGGSEQPTGPLFLFVQKCRD